MIQLEIVRFGVEAEEIAARLDNAEILTSSAASARGYRGLDPLVTVAVIAGGVKLLSDFLVPVLTHLLEMRKMRLEKALKPPSPAPILLELTLPDKPPVRRTVRVQDAAQAEQWVQELDQDPEVRDLEDGSTIRLELVE